MNHRLFLVIFLASLLTSACAIGYQARGSLSDVAGEMRGKGYPGNRGGGRFILNDREGRLRCDGEAFPAKVSGSPESCQGESGEGLARCTDGREIRLQWEAITCRSWRGSGVDEQGNRLEFRVERR